MSYLLTTCLAFTFIRVLEQFFTYIVSLIFRKKERQESKTSNPEYRRLTVNVTPAMYEVIKKHAEEKGMTVTQFVLQSVTNQMKLDKES